MIFISDVIISQNAPSPRKELLHNIDILYARNGRPVYPHTFDTSVRAAIRVGDYKLITGNPGDDSWVPPPEFESRYHGWSKHRHGHHPTDNGRTKHVHFEPGQQNVWLFNITADPEERHDLSTSEPEVVKQLLQRLAYYNSTAVAPIFPNLTRNPTLNVTGGEAPSRAQLLEMVQKLTGRVEQVEEKGNLTDVVIQRRRDGSVDFYRNWEEYRFGFGDIRGNFWLGLDNIHLLTTARNQTLRVDLQDFDNNTAYAEYRFFAIDGPDSFYRLHVDGDSLDLNNNHAFSTHDSDHDSWSSNNCAVDRHGAWWYVKCGYSSLNGPYLTSAQRTAKSIFWHHWTNTHIALNHVEMKIRPAM
nr:hypothetical protein BaRGS_016590 [Batillaria attramentaria]